MTATQQTVCRADGAPAEVTVTRPDNARPGQTPTLVYCTRCALDYAADELAHGVTVTLAPIKDFR